MHDPRDQHARLRDVDLNLLVVLSSLRQHGSVTRAASELGLTQSGASRSLARLRDALDDPLFVMEGGRLRPTPRCDALADDLARCLDGARAVLQTPVFDACTARGTIAVGMPDHLAYLFARDLLARIHADAPGLDLVVRAFSRDWLAELREGSVELAFGVVRGDESGLRARWPRTEDQWVVLLRRGHPVLRGPWTVARFAGGEHGLMAVDGKGPSHVDQALAERGLRRRVSYRATSPLVVALAAAETDLRVTTTARLAQALAQKHPLVVRPLPKGLAPAPLRLPLVWHERMQNDPRHRWLRQVFADVVLE
jgi:DNA-binding transcriptional LysR family regulator